MARLQIRKILELIAFASLVANKNVYTAVFSKVSKAWNAGDLLKELEQVNPDFYPVPIFGGRVAQPKFTPEGAPSKLRLGGAFDVPSSHSVRAASQNGNLSDLKNLSSLHKIFLTPTPPVAYRPRSTAQPTLGC